MEAGWANSFSLPRVWTLLDDGTLGQRSLPDLELLRTSHTHRSNITVTPYKSNLLQGVRGDSLELMLDIDLGDADIFGIKLRKSDANEEETVISYDVRNRRFIVDRSRSSLTNSFLKDKIQEGSFDLNSGEHLLLHFFIDRSVIELFVNDRGTLATCVYPLRKDSLGVDVFTRGGKATVKKLDAWELRSIWDLRNK